MSDQSGGPIQAPAGWYPDPEHPGQSRYWDGSAWAPSLAALAPAASALSAPSPRRPRRTGVAAVVIWLILFFPVGLFLMWRRRTWNPAARWVISAAFAVLLVISAVAQPQAPTAPLSQAPSSPLSSSTSAAQVPVPTLAGQSRAAAASALSAAGLTLGGVTVLPSATVPAGMIISQTPGPGIPVAPGSPVSITVSSGPTPTPTATPSHSSPAPTPRPTTSPKPKPKPTVKPIAYCGAPANPFRYTLCSGGSLITSPNPDTCLYFNCINNFDNGTGYMVECRDGTYSMSGGRPGACSYHHGESRPVHHV